MKIYCIVYGDTITQKLIDRLKQVYPNRGFWQQTGTSVAITVTSKSDYQWLATDLMSYMDVPFRCQFKEEFDITSVLNEAESELNLRLRKHQKAMAENYISIFCAADDNTKNNLRTVMEEEKNILTQIFDRQCMFACFRRHIEYYRETDVKFCFSFFKVILSHITKKTYHKNPQTWINEFNDFFDRFVNEATNQTMSRDQCEAKLQSWNKSTITSYGKSIGAETCASWKKDKVIQVVLDKMSEIKKF